MLSAAPHLSGGDVDLRDGWALMLLDELVGGFGRAHQADPTIPRLSTYGLRSTLRPRRTKKQPEPPAVPPATPTP
jgi:hypothetical protein